jgi:hypothetical protein
MKIVKGNLWDSKDDLILVTCNSYLRKDGALVMGRGAALELKEKYPGLPRSFGAWIEDTCGHLGEYGVIVFPLILLKVKEGSWKYRGVFQVKKHFKFPAQLDVIEHSCNILLDVMKSNHIKTTSMNFPGIGFGQLKYEDVLPIVEKLPDSVTLYMR